MSDGPPRRLSSSSLSARSVRQEAFYERVLKRYRARVASGQLDAPDHELEHLARIATLETNDLCTDERREGEAIGEARERLKHVSDDAE